jgi:hypothetical protein
LDEELEKPAHGKVVSTFELTGITACPAGLSGDFG